MVEDEYGTNVETGTSAQVYMRTVLTMLIRMTETVWTANGLTVSLQGMHVDCGPRVIPSVCVRMCTYELPGGSVGLGHDWDAYSWPPGLMHCKLGDRALHAGVTCMAGGTSLHCWPCALAPPSDVHASAPAPSCIDLTRVPDAATLHTIQAPE